MAEKRTTTEQAGNPVPRARAAADPPPAKASKAAKATKAAKKTTGAKAGKSAKTAEPAKSAAPAKAAEPPKTAKAQKATKTTKAAKATKSTRTTKAAKATKSTAKPPAQRTPEPLPAQPPARQATPPPAAPGAWTAAVREALSQPDQPPQRLAELAVAELGPRAAAWAGWLRDTYPDPPAHGIARLAAHEARRAGWAVAFAEAGGPVTAALSLPAAAWVRAMLVLRIAAAYGHDPTDPQRAADLIMLLDLRPARGPLPGVLNVIRGRRRRLAGFAAARIGVRRAPVLAALRMLIAGGDLGEQLDQLAHRAASYYRPGSQDRTSASAASISSPNKP